MRFHSRSFGSVGGPETVAQAASRVVTESRRRSRRIRTGVILAEVGHGNSERRMRMQNEENGSALAYRLPISSFCIRILRSNFPWPKGNRTVAQAASKVVTERRRRSRRIRTGVILAEVGHGKLERRMRMQNEENGARWPTDSQFLHSAFAFCVLIFHGLQAILPHPRSPSTNFTTSLSIAGPK